MSMSDKSHPATHSHLQTFVPTRQESKAQRCKMSNWMMSPIRSSLVIGNSNQSIDIITLAITLSAKTIIMIICGLLWWWWFTISDDLNLHQRSSTHPCSSSFLPSAYLSSLAKIVMMMDDHLGRRWLISSTSQDHDNHPPPPPKSGSNAAVVS